MSAPANPTPTNPTINPTSRKESVVTSVQTNDLTTTLRTIANASATVTEQATPSTPLAKPMTEYSAHPHSEIFPRMEDVELAGLAEDIKANRLREPIWLYEDKILDGNNRYRACLKIAYPLKEGDFRQFDPKTQGEPLAFVVSANLHRRHLNESQRAAIAAGLVSSKLGYNRYNKAVRDGVTNEAAAKMLGVSEAIVKMAKVVADKAAPEIFEKVQKGELRLAAAKQIVGKPKHQQAAELARIKAESEERKAAAKAAKAANAPKTSNATKKEPEANQDEGAG